MSQAGASRVTGAGILADLGGLPETSRPEPTVMAFVRYGLTAIAGEIRDIKALRDDADPVDDLLEMAASLIDPKARR